jgi:hypothetical protein
MFNRFQENTHWMVGIMPIVRFSLPQIRAYFNVISLSVSSIV